MNVRELIDELLKHNIEPSAEVMIASADKQVAIYSVSIGRTSRATRVLLIEPDENMTTMGWGIK